MIVREMPYTNLHDLNIDWILKIVKDFQDRYQNLDETFQSMLQQITTAGNNAVEAINNNEETALEAIRVFMEQCVQALDTETTNHISEIQNVTNNQLDAINAAGTNQIGLIDQDGTSQLSAISSAGTAQVNIINGLITSLPQTYEDSVNQLQIINAVLNQTYNYPPLVQGHYADQNESDSKTLVADNYRVSTLLSTGCASKRIKIQVTNVAGIIRDIIYWTGWGGDANSHYVPVSTSASDEKTLYTYTFPATATYFTIVFAYDYNMGTQLLVSDLQVSLQWQFTALESIEINEHGFDVSNTNALEFVIPGNTNLTIEEGSEIDEIDVTGGSKSVATSHKLKDSTARESVSDLKSTFTYYKKEIGNFAISQNLFDVESIKAGGYYKNDGTIYEHIGSYYSDQYIPVVAGTEYTFTDDNDTLYICTYDEAHNFYLRVDPTSTTYTPASGVAYVRLSVYNTTFPENFKFTKTADFNSSLPTYGALVDGEKIIKKTVGKDVVTSDIEVDLTSSVTYSILSNDFPLLTYTADTYIYSNGNIRTLSGYGLYVFQAVDDYQIWEDTNDTITGSDDLMLAVYNSAPQSDSIATRYRRETSGGVVSSDTLPSSSSKLTVAKGQYVAIAINGPGTYNFKFHASGLTDGYKIFRSNVLLNPDQSGALTVEVGTGEYTITINGFTVLLKYEQDQETRKDLWTIRGITKGATTICTYGTDIIGVIKEVGQTDYMGGLHGDETSVAFRIYADGNPVTADVECKQVDVLMYSHLTRPSTGDNVIDRYVHIIFRDNYIDVETTFVCLVDNFSLLEALNGGMFAWIDTSASFQMSNVGIINANGGTSNATLQRSHDLYSATATINNNIVTAENIVGKENESYFGETYYYGSTDKRIKMYYTTDSNTTWNTGHTCKGKARYTLN